jgi:hypothetical protein
MEEIGIRRTGTGGLDGCGTGFRINFTLDSADFEVEYSMISDDTGVDCGRAMWWISLGNVFGSF